MSLLQESFGGRVALVTGAEGAIGSAVCEAFSQVGARVIRADQRGTVAAASAGSADGAAIALDVRDATQVRAVFASLEAAGLTVDTLVNVAGVVSFGSAEALAESEWDRVIDINLKGTFLCCQAAIAGMKRLQFGRIINLGSVVGKNSGNARPWISPDEQAVAGNIAYGTSKAGVHMLTGFLARELASHGITVNALAPGPIATTMTTAFPPALRALIPRGRMGSPNDVARAALFLAGRHADFITGEILDINGGMWSD
jgi:NAD(P)-dependent dehydrogenase (short-subunit alcohol dehydrogenase family)